MKIACCWMYAIGAYGFPPKLDDMKKAIAEMAQMGFTYIELEGMGFENLESVIQARDELKHVVQDHEVEVVDFAPLIPEITSLDPELQGRALKYFRRGCQTARMLGCPRVWIDSYAPPVKIIEGKTFSQDMTFGNPMYVEIPEDFSWGAFWDHFVNTMRRCNEIAKDEGVEFLIEPRVHEVTSNSDGLLRLFDAVADDNIGAILDTAHQYAQKELLPLAIEKLGEKIRYVHIADNDGRDNRHLVPGEGTIDWDGVFTALKKIGFDGMYACDLEKLPDLKQQFIRTREFLEAAAETHGI